MLEGPANARVGARVARGFCKVRAMYWPLIGGFIVFVLIAVLLGWITDTSRGGDADGH